MKKVIKGINIRQFVNGWWGEHKEGEDLLCSLGLPTKTVPFNIETLLTENNVDFEDINGNVISICLNRNDAYFDFSCIYRGKKRTFRLYREWESEDLDAILRLESYSLGDCLRQIISGRNII